MLERATACLKSGAFRDSLRCARDRPRRSRRLLHSTFWSHGGGDLDLPPYVLSDGSTVNSTPDAPAARGPFLDFLYPPQALAWLQTKQGQRMQRWEARNLSRLPKGYIVASRRHASNSYRPFDKNKDKTAREGLEHARRKPRAEYGPPAMRRLQGSAMNQRKRATEGQAVPARPLGGSQTSLIEQGDWGDAEILSQDGSMGEPEAWADTTMPSYYQRNLLPSREGVADPLADELDEVDQRYYGGFGDSPGELAETTTDRVQQLRNLLATMQLRRQDAELNEDNSLARRAWSVYSSLDEEVKDDQRLKQELIQWMATQDGEAVMAHCHELFTTMPKSSKTIEVYKAIITLQARQKNYDQVSELHREALENLENGYFISRHVVESALNDRDWQLVANTTIQHNQVYAEKHQQNQVRLFWLWISGLPKLFDNAVQIVRHFGFVDGLRSADEPSRDFCLQFFKEAITQEFIQQEDGVRSYTGGRAVPPRRSIRPMFQHVIDMDSKAGQFLEQVLLAALRPESTIEYRKYHHVFSYIYQQYCDLPGLQPSEAILSAFLRRLTEYWSGSRQEFQDALTMSIQKLLVDWKRFYGQVSAEAVHSLLSYHASSGDKQRFDEMLEYQDSVYPAYEVQKEAFWTRIYLHAQREELDLAQQAFAEVARLTREHGDQPDLRCWNVLLRAHSHVDDLEGALTNFQNIIDYAKLEPDIDSFRPLIAMLSSRGDVAGLEDLLEQYDDMVGEPRSADMMLSLMTAHFRVDDNVAKAEETLQETITMKKQGEVVGSLTPCFNALMEFYAIRRDIDAATRVYRWMREEKVLLDGDTFGALLQTLLYHRQLWPCYRILRKIMPDHHVRPTAYHFALIMAGFNYQGYWERTIRLHEYMLRLNIRPSVGTNVNYLKAKALQERAQAGEDSSAQPDDAQVPLEATVEELKRLIAERDHSHMISKSDTPVLGGVGRQDAITPYFDFLIYTLGADRCFDVVKKLFKQYTELLKDEIRDDQIPIRMLSALMAAHWYAGEYDKVEEYWKLAVDQARDVNRIVRIPRFVLASGREDKSQNPLNLKPSEPDAVTRTTTEGDSSQTTSNESNAGTLAMNEPNQTLLTQKADMKSKPYPGGSDILDRPLRWYICALMSQARIGEAIKLVSQLLTQGYFIGRKTWNIFIRQILNTQPPLTLLAFVLTERFMMPHFPGWSRKRWSALRPANRAQGTQLMRARYISRTEIMPEYLTLAQLGQAMLDLRRIELIGDRQAYKQLPKDLRKFVGSIKDLRMRAKETVHAVQTMPPMPRRKSG